MAKQKTTADSAISQEETIATPEVTPTQPEASKSQKLVDTHIEQILRVFRAYENLYVDSHGGVYTPDTPAAIRGSAMLYKNPFYEPKSKLK